MRPHEIREFNNEELTKELEGAQRALLNLRFRLATKQLNNTSEIRRSQEEPGSSQHYRPESGNWREDKVAKQGRKIRVGRVVGDKMDKTVVVAVRWQQRHRLYQKSLRRVTKFYAHDQDNRCRVGDLVRIEEAQPISPDETLEDIRRIGAPRGSGRQPHRARRGAAFGRCRGRRRR